MMFFQKFTFVAWCVMAAGTLALPSTHAAAPEGREVYRAECARCHGKNGEGVPKKYKDALYGDWSVEKLTRYVVKNMPDDDPGTLTEPEAQVVSRYIHETFYSPEARA